MSISINITMEHLIYLRDDFGVGGFLKKFGQKKVISFMRWITREIKAIERSQDVEPDVHNYVGQVQLPQTHFDICSYALSILSYKILCETLGKVPSEYMETINELKNLIKKAQDDFEKEQGKASSVSYMSTDEFRKELAQEVVKIYHQVLEFGNSYGDFPVDIPKISPKLSYHFSRGSGRSFAQDNKRVSLALEPFVGDHKTGSYFYWEYKSIKDKKKIGEFTTPNWTLPIYALVCHELAHSFQMTIEKVARLSKPEVSKLMAKPHGKGWQQIYEVFREQFVNKELYPNDYIDGNQNQ